MTLHYKSSVIGLLVAALILIGGVTVARGQTQTPAHNSYPTPKDAADDLIAATKAKDSERLSKIFGPDLVGVLSGDPVQDAAEFESFSAKVAEQTALVRESDTKYILNIGNEEWPFPIPIVKQTGGQNSGQNGRWVFDTKAGADEIVTRRIGENELKTMMTCKAYAIAQWEYFLEGDWDNDHVQEFAQKVLSQPGRKDGLYWPTVASEAASPLGALVAYAREKGYSPKNPKSRTGRGAGESQPMPYQGYYFKILKAQGPHAPGGKYDYVTNGNMIGGFALLAYPAKYGSSGVMSFIVNQQGRVYEKDLGPNTASIAKAMTRYDPGASWKLAEDEVKDLSGVTLDRVR